MKPKKKAGSFMPTHLELVTDTVANPDWRPARDGEKAFPRYVSAVRNVRESGVSLLASKGALNEAQVAAADKFRRLFEAMGASGARGIDMTREYVDGGRFPDPIGTEAINAGKHLAAAYEVVVKAHGVYGWKIIGYVCGEGRSVHELTSTRRQRDTLTDNLRTYLDVLAAHWDFQTKRGQSAKRFKENLTTRA
jgi:hypothetical protein